MPKSTPDNLDIRVHALKVPGLPCPVCTTPIVVDPMLLLSTAAIECPACGLELKMNVEKSAGTLNALSSYMQAFGRLHRNYSSQVGDMVGGGRESDDSGGRSRGRRPPRRRARRRSKAAGEAG